MKHIKMTIENGEFGIGFKPLRFENWTNYIPSTGVGLAHDLLEHGANETGSIFTEIEAIGALLFVREFGRGAITFSIEDWGRDNAYQILDQYWESTEEEFPSYIPKYYIPSEYKTDLLEAIQKFRIGLEYHKLSKYSEERQIESAEMFLDNWQSVRQLIINGFCKAYRRYNGVSMSWVYSEIGKITEKKAKEYAQYADSDITFTLSYDSDYVKFTPQYEWL